MTEESVLQKVDYESADKESFSQIVNTKFPKELMPSKRISAIFGLIFIVVLIISATQFPLSSMMSGKSDFVISVGFPLHFLKFDTSGKDNSPASPINLVIDLFLYLILAYAIDVSLNLMFIKREKEENGQKPVVFNDQKVTVADKIVKKVFGN